MFSCEIWWISNHPKQRRKRCTAAEWGSAGQALALGQQTGQNGLKLIFDRDCVENAIAGLHTDPFLEDLALAMADTSAGTALR